MGERALIAGWFSFHDGHATAGDLISKDVVCGWLEGAGFAFDTALAPPFQGGVDWREVDPGRYWAAIFICGPFGRKPYETEFLSKFADCRLFGLNLSMDSALSDWNPFDVLVERDSPSSSNPDLVFSGPRPTEPLIGICLVEDHPEANTALANERIAWLVQSNHLHTVPIDTRLDSNAFGLASPRAIELLISRMDVVITTRLHGVVLSLKNGVPALAVDAVPGGGKISKQCRRIGWDCVLQVEGLSNHALSDALAFCRSDAARRCATDCARRAVADIEALKHEFMARFKPVPRGSRTAFEAERLVSILHVEVERGANAKRGMSRLAKFYRRLR